jgi:hypothetical protein
MSFNSAITFAVATNSREILQDNFLSSPCFAQAHPHQILIQEGFTSACAAYNDAIKRSTNDLIVFVHQDILLPESWLHDLEISIDSLSRSDRNWGVLGCYGETLVGGGYGYIYSGGIGLLGKPFDSPAAVQTLDEIVLILRRSSNLRFDDRLPGFHFYGADICMAASAQGMNNYVIPAFCVHNTQQNYYLPGEFYDGYRFMKRKWKDALPIRTTCVRITKSNSDMYRKRIREAYLRFVRGKKVSKVRVKHGLGLLQDLQGVAQPSSQIVDDKGGTNWR